MSENKKSSDAKGTESARAVTNIAEAIHKRNRKDKPDRKTIIRNVYQAMLHDELLFHWPDFPHKLFVFEDQRGARLPVELTKGDVIRPMAHEAVTNLVLQFSELLVLSFGTELALKVAEAKEAASLWNANAPVLKHSQIAPVRFKSDKGYTWHRLDFDPEEGPSPTFDELTNRIDNADHVMAWIGSLFIPESSRQNYLWLYGAGGQGKSSISRFLARLLGDSYRSEMVPDRSSIRFWSAGLLGSRLVVFPDCESPSFVTSAMFKSITGDDPVKIEFKNESPVSLNLDCKLMFTANGKPHLSGSRADMRRIIYSKIAPLDLNTKLIPPSHYRSMLWEERKAFIHKCIGRYNLVFKDHGDLSLAEVSTQVGLADLIDDAEDWAEQVYSEFFRFSDYTKNMNPATWPRTPLKYISRIAKEFGWKRRKVAKFYDFLERKSPKIVRYRLRNERGFYGILPASDATSGEQRTDY